MNYDYGTENQQPERQAKAYTTMMMMIGSSRRSKTSIFSVFTTTTKKRTIIVGLKCGSFSREMLFSLLNFFVLPMDTVLAIHVQEPQSDTFDPNTFYMHEDLCKSKQVNLHVKVSVGSSYANELSRQVRITFASTLVIGCTSCWTEDSSVFKLLKSLPPSCTLLVMDRRGKIVLQKPGTSQLGSLSKALQSTSSSITSHNKAEPKFNLRKSITMPTSLTLSPPRQNVTGQSRIYTKRLSFPEVTNRMFDQFATLEIKGNCKRYYYEELKFATNDFSTDMLIGEGGHSKVYRADFADGQSAAVKVLNVSQHSDNDLFQEVEILNGLKHENIVQLLGFCYCRNMQAVVYTLLKESLKHKLKHLEWHERMRLAIGVAKALDYLHSASPPIVHRDVKSSNILLSENGQPQLSDFGSALVLTQAKKASTFSKPIRVVGTFGYMAPEYMMYGKVDEKIDVYSYGVVLLELITGKEAIQTRDMSKQESLVLWARSLLSSELWERLIDPGLNNKYQQDEMKTMMIAARFCLLYSSKRPSIRMILRLLEDPSSWMNTMHMKRDELLETIAAGNDSEVCRNNSFEFCDTTILADDD